MTGLEFCRLLGEVEPAYLQEAYFRPAPVRRGRLSRAVCLAAGVLLFAVFLSALPRVPSDPEEGAVSGGAAVRVSMDDIRVNEQSGEVTEIWNGPGKIWDVAFCRYEDWGREEIAAYYGRELTPAWLPAGLRAARSNGTAQIGLAEDGTILQDAVTYSFFHDCYEDGSPRNTEDAVAPHGLSLTASRLGLPDDCIVTGEAEVSRLFGTEAVFRHWRRPYGPYDPETREPAGTYDFYLVEFEQDGVSYRLAAYQLELEEVVKTAASLLSGCAEIELIL